MPQVRKGGGAVTDNEIKTAMTRLGAELNKHLQASTTPRMATFSVESLDAVGRIVVCAISDCGWQVLIGDGIVLTRKVEP